MSCLRDARKAAGLTQVQLAERAGVDQTHISNLETGRVRNPSWETVRRLADVLAKEPGELFPADGQANPAA